MYKHTQRSWSGGQIDRELMGRQDLQKYFTGASKLQNLLVRRQGNLAKRRGTDEACDLTRLLGQDGDGGPDIPLGDARLFPLVFDRKQGYHILVAGRRAYLCSRKGVRAVTYQWLRSIGDYDGTVDYSARYTTAETFACTIGLVGYDSLAEAFADAQNGDTVRLGKDLTLGANLPLTFAGSVTLDLAGHTIESTYDGSVDSVIDGITLSGATTHLTVTDSVGGGTITQPQAVESHLFAIRNAGAKLTIAGGRIIARAKKTASAWRAAVCVAANATYEGTGGVVANEAEAPASASSWPYPVNALLMLNGAVNVNISGGLYRSGRWTTSVPDVLTDYKSAGLFCTNSATAAQGATIDISGGLLCGRLGGAMDGVVSADTLTLTRKINVTGGALCGWGDESGSIKLARCEAFCPNTREGFQSAMASGTTYRETREVPFRGTYTFEVHRCAPSGEADYSADWDGTDSHWAADAPGDVPETTDLRPFYVSVPWDDADLADLSFCQSGDTIFFAHRSYPPSRIEFNPASCTLAYVPCDFNASTVKPPKLVTPDLTSMNTETKSVSTNGAVTTVTYNISNGTKTTICHPSSGSDTSATASCVKRTVQYCVSCVKDGVEGPPSAAQSATYLAPWPEGDRIRLKFTKGGNASEPDEYRVYKKQGAEFGLIGTVSRAGIRTPDPTVVAPEGAQGIARGSFRAYGAASASTFSTPTAEEIKGRAPASPCEAWSVEREGAAGKFVLWPGVGALSVPSGKKASFSFGATSNVFLAAVTVKLDSHFLCYEEQADGTAHLYDDIDWSGKTLCMDIRHRKKDGSDAQTLHKAYTFTGSNLHEGTETADRGAVPADAGRDRVASLVAKPRSVRFALSIADRQVESITIYARDDSSSSATSSTARLVLAGVAFEPVDGFPTTDGYVYFDDDYITPDLSQTPVEADNPFATSADYPGCVGIHQQRLVYASSRSDPAGVRMSAVGDLYSFSPHKSMREDDPISLSLAATEFPDINHLVVTRDVILLADGGEWKVAPVSGNALTYKTVSATLQSRNGSCRPVKPMAVGDEVVYADAAAMGLRATRYNYASDGYESTDLTVLCANIFDDNPIRQAAYEQFPDSRIKCVLADGAVAVMVYMAEHEVAAWTRCVLGGGALARGVSCSRALVGNTCDTAYLVARGSSRLLWTVRPDLPSPTVLARACMDGCRVLSGTEAAEAWLDGWTAIDVLTAATYASKAALQAADGYGARSYLCGFPFASELVTVRPEPPQQGTIQFEVKNAKDVEVRVLESGSWRAAPYGYAGHAVYAQCFHAHVTATGGAIALETADHTLLLSGANSGDGRVQVVSDDPWPLNILSLSTNYEIQPLSNSEG